MGYPRLPAALADKATERQRELIAQYAISPDEVLVTFVGTLVSSFDFRTVIDTARELSRCEAGVRFMIVGHGDLWPSLRSQAEGLDNVVFTGWFDQASIAAILSMSSVGLAPYRDGASMSLPNKPFEYMSFGLPVLSSLSGELEALIRDERIGLHYQAGAPESLTQVIRWLASHAYEREQMGLRARKLFDTRFSPSVVYERFVRHLEGVAHILGTASQMSAAESCLTGGSR
jgi:glycosyltransferase involved in cell wall biosynthesis